MGRPTPIIVPAATGTNNGNISGTSTKRAKSRDVSIPLGSIFNFIKGQIDKGQQTDALQNLAGQLYPGTSMPQPEASPTGGYAGLSPLPEGEMPNPIGSALSDLAASSDSGREATMNALLSQLGVQQRMQAENAAKAQELASKPPELSDGEKEVVKNVAQDYDKWTPTSLNKFIDNAKKGIVNSSVLHPFNGRWTEDGLEKVYQPDNYTPDSYAKAMEQFHKDGVFGSALLIKDLKSTKNLLVNKQSFEQERSIRQDTEALAKHYEIAMSARNTIDMAENLPGGPTGIKDLTLLYSYIKTLDPDSIVQTAETTMTQGAIPLSGKVKLWYDQIKSGEQLTPQVRKEMIDFIKGKAEYAQQAYNENIEIYKNTVKFYGLNEKNSIYKPSTEQYRALVAADAEAANGLQSLFEGRQPSPLQATPETKAAFERDNPTVFGRDNPTVAVSPTVSPGQMNRLNFLEKFNRGRR